MNIRLVLAKFGIDLARLKRLHDQFKEIEADGATLARYYPSGEAPLHVADSAAPVEFLVEDEASPEPDAVDEDSPEPPEEEASTHVAEEPRPLIEPRTVVSESQSAISNQPNESDLTTLLGSSPE